MVKLQIFMIIFLKDMAKQYFISSYMTLLTLKHERLDSFASGPCCWSIYVNNHPTNEP